MTGRQTRRTYDHACTRLRRRNAFAIFGLSITCRSYAVIAFCLRLRRLVSRRRQERAAAYFREQQAKLMLLWPVMATRYANLQRLASAPRPMRSYDVSYDRTSDRFSFRSAAGEISHRHPAVQSAENHDVIPALSPTGDIIKPLWPPAESDCVLCPEKSGAWCYYDTALGSSQWHAPTGSRPLSMSTRLLDSTSFQHPPPCLDSRTTYESLARTGWHAHYEDAVNRIKLTNLVTGVTRLAPWISLRTTTGQVYFANLSTRETRWFPPHRWMQGWITRQSPFDARSHYSRFKLPSLVGYRQVDGGAPYLDAQGLPQYDRLPSDSDLTYPSVPPGLHQDSREDEMDASSTTSSG